MFGKFSSNDYECFSCKVRKVPPLNVTSVPPLFILCLKMLVVFRVHVTEVEVDTLLTVSTGEFRMG